MVPLILLTLCSIILRVNFVFGLDEKVNECLTESNIDKEIYNQFLKTGSLADEKDNAAKCLFDCFAKKLDVADDTGAIDKDKIIEMLVSKHPEIEKDKIVLSTTLCSQRSETDSCEKWYEFAKCQVNMHLAYVEGKQT